MSDPNDPLRNPRDPLHKEGLPGEQELFKRLAHVCAEGQFPLEMVMGACMNLLVNAARQGYATRAQAEQRYDWWTQRFKQVLLNHYDGAGNRKLKIFPFDQVIEMPHFKELDQFLKTGGRKN